MNWENGEPIIFGWRDILTLRVTEARDEDEAYRMVEILNLVIPQAEIVSMVEGKWMSLHVRGHQGWY